MWVSAIQQHESPIGIYMSLPLEPPLPPPTPSYPSRLSQSTEFELTASYSKFPLATYFTYGSAYVSMFSSVQFSLLVVSNSLQPRGLQHARLPCPSPTPGACSNSCPSSWWCHPTISSSVIPFSSCPQSLPASGSFPMNRFFTSGGQSIGVSASASVFPMNTLDWFPSGWTGSISLQSKGLQCFSVTLSFHPSLSFLHHVHISVLYIWVTIAALQISFSVPSSRIPYIFVNVWYLFFSFWFTSLYIIGPRFIHPIGADSNISLYLCTKNSLSIHLLMNI